MHEKHSFYSVVNKTSKIVNEITNFICVVLLTAQVISILIMVGGRYIFHNSPAWTEQFALFCMIWFTMLSISLGVAKDNHVKIDIIDRFVKGKGLFFLKCFANVCIIVWGVVLIVYGMSLSKLTWSTMLSAFRVPVGLQYAAAVVGGVLMSFNSIVSIIQLVHTEFFKEDN